MLWDRLEILLMPRLLVFRRTSIFQQRNGADIPAHTEPVEQSETNSDWQDALAPYVDVGAVEVAFQQPEAFPDPEKILSMALDYIDTAREKLKLRKYEPGKFGAERVLMDMAARREIEKAAKPHLGIY